MVNLRDFRIGWRLLVSEPAYSVVVITCLALGFAASFLLFSYVHFSLNYDSQVPDNERIYTVKERINTFFAASINTDSLPLPFSDIARQSGLVSALSIVHGIDVVIQADHQSVNIEISAVDEDFPKIFGLHAAEGDLDFALRQPEAIALTMTTARKLFGTAHVLNKRITIDGDLFQVAALLADPPVNTNQPYAALVGTHSVAWSASERDRYRQSWGDGAGRLYVKLRPGASAVALEKILQDASDQYGFGDALPPEVSLKLGTKKPRDVQLVRLSDRYFDPDLKRRGVSGDRYVVIGLAAVAGMILLLATSNYINLNIVRAVRRQREIGLRKLLGASAAQLVGLFLVESFIVIFVAAALGLIVAWLCLPLFSELMLRDLEGQFTPTSVAITFTLSFFVAALTGIYPAWIALKVKPLESLSGRGNHETRSGLQLRRLLTVLQFTAAIGFTGLTLSIAWQVYFSSHVSPGFSPEKLAVITLPVYLLDEHGAALRDEISRLPSVLGVATSSNSPGNNSYMVGHEMKDTTGHIVSIGAQQVSPNYFEVYGIKARAGRLFDAHLDRPDNTRLVVLNQLAAHVLGFSNADSAIGKNISYRQNDWQVIGIAPDIRHQSTRENAQALVYQLSARTPVLTIRFAGDQAALESQVELLWQRAYPAYPFHLRSAQSALTENYEDDLRMAKLFLASSALAILIAAFGIYVLSAYTVQRRQREIVLRKLYGASGSAIAQLLALEFGGLIVLSALLGLPIAYLSSANYLAQFVEHPSAEQLPLLGAFLISVLIAFLAVLRHALVAVHISPRVALQS